MFTEPLTITIDGVANNLRRIQFQPNGRFSLPDGSLVLELAQNSSKSVERFNARLQRRVVAADPLNAAVQRVYTRRYWFGSDGPLNGIGISDAQAGKDIAGFLTWCATVANYNALIGGES